MRLIRETHACYAFAPFLFGVLLFLLLVKL